jgi:hypothetical protein
MINPSSFRTGPEGQDIDESAVDCGLKKISLRLWFWRNEIDLISIINMLCWIRRRGGDLKPVQGTPNRPINFNNRTTRKGIDKIRLAIAFLDC